MAGTDQEFQSSPDPKAGRNTQTMRILAIAMFQSSPDPKAGRNDMIGGNWFNIPWFQSSPDPKAGRNLLRWRLGHYLALRVPILARPEGRAQLLRLR